MLQGLLPLHGLQPHCHLKQIGIHAVTLPLLNLLEHIVRQPRQKAPVPLIKRIQDTVNTLGNKRPLVQFHLIRGKLSYLP